MTIKEIINQMWTAIKARFSTATNLVNGSAVGSLRTSFARAEDESYTMGVFSFAEGRDCMARDAFSHAEGEGTIAHAHQHVQGRYNVEDPYSKYFHIVGGGDSKDARSNLYTLDKEGNGWFKGNVYIGGTDMNDLPAVKTCATLDVYNNLAVGMWCSAIGRNQLICGNGNAPDTENKYAFIVGAGDDDSPQNGVTVDRRGNVWLLNNLYVGTNSSGASQDACQFNLRDFWWDTTQALKDMSSSLASLNDSVRDLTTRLEGLESQARQ